MDEKKLHRTWFGIVTALLIAVSVLLYEFESRNGPDDTFRDAEFTCMLDLRDMGDGDVLLSGYNYLLVKKFADHLGAHVSISCNYGDCSTLDSLKQGSVEMIVIPFAGASDVDSVLVSRPVDSTTVWIIQGDRKGSMTEINEWIAMNENDEKSIAERSLFIHRFSPQKAASNGRRFTHISPYDDIFRKYADTLGWDWRLLAAVAFIESGFHIEAHSPRGAMGLMQMMPVTARQYDVTNLLDPEESLRAGTDYLDRLQRMFTRNAADKEELIKFTLAAYNAGEGRLKDCITYAGIIGRDQSTWDGLAAAIPGMEDESILQLDTIKTGVFHGQETISYIDSVMDIYDAFCAICPR